MAEPLDLEALKEYRAAIADADEADEVVVSVEINDLRDFLAALERIPELERDRDTMRRMHHLAVARYVRLESALAELVRRAADFRREAFGEDQIAVRADIMLRAALKDAESALAPTPEDSESACARCGKDPAEGYASIGNRRYCHGEEQPSCYERAVGERAGVPSPPAPASGEEGKG